jgi:hypothetical protein
MMNRALGLNSKDAKRKATEKAKTDPLVSCCLIYLLLRLIQIPFLDGQLCGSSIISQKVFATYSNYC